MTLELQKQETASALLGLEAPAENLRTIFEKINVAESPRDLLYCLVELQNSGVSLDAALERLADDLIPKNSFDVVANILSLIFDKLEPEVLSDLMKLLDEPASIRALINLLAVLQRHEINFYNLDLNVAGDDGVGESEEVVSRSEGLLSDSEKVKSIRRSRSKMPSKPKQGMQLTSDGEYKNSPSKDVVRRMWGDRLAQMISRDEKMVGTSFLKRPAQIKVLSLMGEEALELPIYEGLGIDPKQIWSPEFNGIIADRMKARVPFNVIRGNLYDAYVETHKEDPLKRFDVMNLDLCATFGSFFTTEDKLILHKLADNAELSINTRARQDKVDLDVADSIVETMKTFLPEYQKYFDALLEQKVGIFPDPEVAANMVRRQMGTVFSLISNFPSHAFDCCRKADEQYQGVFHAFKFVTGLVNSGQFPFKEGADAYDKALHVSNCVFSPEIAEISKQMSWSADLKNLKEARRRLRENKQVEGGRQENVFSGEIDDVIHRGVAEEFKQYGLDGEPDRNDPRYLRVVANSKLIWVMMATSMASRYCNVGLKNVSCVTYTHDQHHTFQNWMISIRRNSKPVSVLDTLRNALDSLINSPEVFVDGNANVREWNPTERRKVEINTGRVLDLHRDHEGFKVKERMLHGHRPESVKISSVERLKRQTRRKIEKASRKKNR